MSREGSVRAAMETARKAGREYFEQEAAENVSQAALQLEISDDDWASLKPTVAAAVRRALTGYETFLREVGSDL